MCWTLKGAFVCQQSHAKRGGELDALAISLPHLCWWLDDSEVTLQLNIRFLSEVISPKFENQLIDLAAFSEGKPAENVLLYLVRALNCIMKTKHPNPRQTVHLLHNTAQVK